MAEFALPPSDEPVDFRRQAAIYGRYRRDYSAALYAALEARTGPAAGRVALDLGCGTGFVTRALARRGWRAVGVDFSEPMLTETGRAGGGALGFVRARAEALPVRDGAAVLLTCGTAFHWFAPAPALAEIARALAPGGWAALFWRYPLPGQAHTHVVGDALRRAGVETPEGFEHLRVHPSEPFAGSVLAPEPGLEIESTLAFTPGEFHGYIATVEWLRRLAGARHPTFLTILHDELTRRYPAGFRERNVEHVFLARRGRPGRRTHAA